MMAGIDNIFDVASRSMSAQLVRLNTIASNLANAGNISGSEDQAYRAMGLYGDESYSSRPKVPNQIGAYALIAPIGKGGMGHVYRACHNNRIIAERQGGDVAIKRMHTQYARDPQFRARFDREASMGLKLNHPGIVKVHDLVEDGGELALVMDLAQGKPLSQLIGDEVGPIPWEKTWPIFEQILSAVGYAHQQGVVHRDIKPENIMVSQDGVIKILDFGIAKELSQGKWPPTT